MNSFRGRGNLADAPVLKQVKIDDEQRQVAEMRVYFDRLVPDSAGGFEDKGGFWLEVNCWGERAEGLTQHLVKGARVYVEGSLTQDEWNDTETGQTRARMKLNADYVAVDLTRVQQIRFKSRTGAAKSASQAAELNLSEVGA